MTSLKRSTERSPTFGNNGNRKLLYDALNFFFTIKGVEFQKFHTSFTIPSAEQFIEYSHYTNHCLVSNKYTKPRFLELQHFLQFICNNSYKRNNCENVLKCKYVCFMSLVAYSVTSDVLETQRTASIQFKNANVLYPFHWYISNILTSAATRWSFIERTAKTYLTECVAPDLVSILKPEQLVGPAAITSTIVCSSVSSIFQKTDAYDYYLQLPYITLLYKRGNRGFLDILLKKMRLINE